MQGEGVNLRRGQGKAKATKAAPLVFFYCLGTVICILFVVTYFVVTQKTVNSLNNYADASAEARNLLVQLPSFKMPDQKSAPPGTSVVECTAKTPEEVWSKKPPSGVVTIYLWHDFAPISCQIFLDMVKAKHFDGTFIFRVMKGFIAQWGIRHKEIQDLAPMGEITKGRDAVTSQTLSNVRGTLSFTGGNPHAKQVFVNLGDNRRLDAENSRPFATVDDSSMYFLDNLYTGYKDGQGQVKAMAQGLEAIHSQFPHWSQIDACRVVLQVDESETNNQQ